MATLGNSPNTVVSIDYSYIATAGQTVITGLDKDGKVLQFNTNKFDVFVNGRLIPTSDYVTGVSIITLNYALALNDFVTVRSYGTWQLNSNLPIAGGVMQGSIDMNWFNLFDVPSINGAGVQLPHRNKVVDPNFDFWVNTTGTGSGYVAATMWAAGHLGATKTVSRQSHTLGQTAVPGGPSYFHRTQVTGAGSTADDNCASSTAIEYVKTLAGKTATVTFWAKADSNKNIAVELAQYFGSGGSPSSTVVAIGSRQVSLTTSWQKFSFTVAIPSIAGKTLGTANNDYLALNIWYSAGSSHAARTASLPLQTGTFDISSVSLVEGDATGEADPTSPRSIGLENLLVNRYYSQNSQAFGRAVSTTQSVHVIDFFTPMRAAPTISLINGSVNLQVNGSTSAYTITATANQTDYQSSLFSLTRTAGTAWATGDTVVLTNSNVIAFDARL